MTNLSPTRAFKAYHFEVPHNLSKNENFICLPNQKPFLPTQASTQMIYSKRLLWQVKFSPALVAGCRPKLNPASQLLLESINRFLPFQKAFLGLFFQYPAYISEVQISSIQLLGFSVLLGEPIPSFHRLPEV